MKQESPAIAAKPARKVCQKLLQFDVLTTLSGQVRFIFSIAE